MWVMKKWINEWERERGGEVRGQREERKEREDREGKREERRETERERVRWGGKEKEKERRESRGSEREKRREKERERVEDRENSRRAAGWYGLDDNVLLLQAKCFLIKLNVGLPVKAMFQTTELLYNQHDSQPGVYSHKPLPQYTLKGEDTTHIFNPVLKQTVSPSQMLHSARPGTDWTQWMYAGRFPALSTAAHTAM